MFFNKNNILIYLRRTSLEVYYGNEKEELKFPPTVYQNIEVLDSENFQKIFKNFLTNLKLKKQDALIILSDEILFQKEIVAADEADLKIKSENFLDSIPISTDKIKSKKIKVNEKIVLLASNKRVYETVNEVVSSLNLKVKSVVPLTLFKDKLKIEDDELSTSLAKKIFSEKDLIDANNFLSEAEAEIAGNKSMTKFFLLLGVLLLIIALTVLLAFRLKILNFTGFFGKQERDVKVNINQPESTQSAEPEESTKSSVLTKDVLKVQIFNGSGVAGQAASLRDQLVELGYNDENIELGNATGSGETVVIFSKKVSEEVHEELMKKLEENFKDVTIQDETDAESEFDIVITTGL